MSMASEDFLSLHFIGLVGSCIPPEAAFRFRPEESRNTDFYSAGCLDCWRIRSFEWAYSSAVSHCFLELPQRKRPFSNVLFLRLKKWVMHRICKNMGNNSPIASLTNCGAHSIMNNVHIGAKTPPGRGVFADRKTEKER